MFDLQKIARTNILNLVPYSSARKEYEGNEGIFLDANENAFGSPVGSNYNRYPDPLQNKLKEKIAALKNVTAENIFIGNGSDEAIDLLFRIFCRPGKDKVIVCPPTYGMYEVAAGINEIKVQKINLKPDFTPDTNKILRSVEPNTRIIFICSPNNPTGNSIPAKEILDLLDAFNGLVVIDEAYIDFSMQESFLSQLNRFPNLVILQTLSKAWGLAGLRIGMAFASQDIISLFSKIKPPYNISTATQELALEALENTAITHLRIRQTIAQREQLSQRLAQFSFVKQVFKSDANFLLVKVKNAEKLYRYLLSQKLIVRNRSRVELCEECLRITVGTEIENKALINALEQFPK